LLIVDESGVQGGDLFSYAGRSGVALASGSGGQYQCRIRRSVICSSHSNPQLCHVAPD
jgi:hypothetical protein